MSGIHGTKGELRLQMQSLEGGKALRFPALVSKNPKPDEKPFRLSWFKMRGNVPTGSGHVSVSQSEARGLVSGRMPERVWLYLVRGFDAQDASFQPRVQAIKERAAEVVRIVLEADEDEGMDFKDVYHPPEQTTFKVYSRYAAPLPGQGLNIEWSFQVPALVAGKRLVNKLSIPFGTSFPAQQHAALKRMQRLAQARQWPAGAEFVTTWGRYLIQNGTITKI